MLYMFRTVLVHLQEQLYKLYIAFGIFRYMLYVWLFCGYSHTTATCMVSVIYRYMRCTAYKVAPDDGLIQSETCTASNEKINSDHKNFVHLVGLYTYCAISNASKIISMTIETAHVSDITHSKHGTWKCVSTDFVCVCVCETAYVCCIHRTTFQ